MDRVLEPEYMDGPEEARSYAAMDHSVPNGAFVARLIELEARGRALDLGCGPGHVPELAVARMPDLSVVGVDAAPAMLALAQRSRRRHPDAARLRYVLGDVKRLPFADSSFDVVFSNTTLHHIPDPVALLAEARRVLAPGGALLVRDLFRPGSPERVAELVALHAGDMEADQQELFRASLCAALTPDELKRAARAAGFERFEVVVDGDRHVSLQRRRGRPAR